MKRRYKNPPILEAVCEVHFELTQPLSTDQIQIMGDAWKVAYPQQQIIQENNVEFRLELGTANVKTNQTGSRLIARASDGTKLAQLSSHFLAVNQLKPYPGWLEAFRADILARVEDAVRLLKLDKIRLINLRYIDRLDFPQRPLVWEDWLAINLPVSKSVPRNGGFFQTHFQQELEADLKLVTTVATLPQERPDITSVILDNIVIWQGATDAASLAPLLDRIHEPLPTIFDELLTPKTQELLGGYENV